MEARRCCLCEQALATVYCAADAAYLCDACDAEVHQSSSIAARHHRTPLASASAEQVSKSFDTLGLCLVLLFLGLLCCVGKHALNSKHPRVFREPIVWCSERGFVLSTGRDSTCCTL